MKENTNANAQNNSKSVAANEIANANANANAVESKQTKSNKVTLKQSLNDSLSIDIDSLRSAVKMAKEEHNSLSSIVRDILTSAIKAGSQSALHKAVTYLLVQPDNGVAMMPTSPDEIGKSLIQAYIRGVKDNASYTIGGNYAKKCIYGKTANGYLYEYKTDFAWTIQLALYMPLVNKLRGKVTTAREAGQVYDKDGNKVHQADADKQIAEYAASKSNKSK